MYMTMLLVDENIVKKSMVLDDGVLVDQSSAVWVPEQMLFPVPCSSSHEVIPKQRIRIVHGKGYYLVPRKPLISVKQLFLDYLPLQEADYAQLQVFDHTSSKVELHTEVGNLIYFEISNGGKDRSLPLW